MINMEFDLYNRMLNIKGNDIEKELQNSIAEVRKQFSKITEERTCQFYTALLYRILKGKNISAYVVDTVDLGFDFSHWFLVVPDTDKKYLADLTFVQFTKYEEYFSDLLISGYQVLDDAFLNKYLSVVLNKEITGLKVEGLWVENQKRML